MTQERSNTIEPFKIKFLATASQKVKDIIRDALCDYGAKRAQKIREDIVTKTKELLANNPYHGRPLY